MKREIGTGTDNQVVHTLTASRMKRRISALFSSSSVERPAFSLKDPFYSFLIKVKQINQLVRYGRFRIRDRYVILVKVSCFMSA